MFWYNDLIATKFFTWHHSYIVVECAKICSNIMSMNGIPKFKVFIGTCAMEDMFNQGPV